jgi:uncharacterized protein (TIGR02996 family)
VEDVFLEAVLNAPADEVARRAYADWLDGRADPRGRFLRAEVDAGRSAAADLPRLARGLDPVWVARVSRPPAGACCVGVRFADHPGRKPARGSGRRPSGCSTAGSDRTGRRPTGPSS